MAWEPGRAVTWSLEAMWLWGRASNSLLGHSLTQTSASCQPVSPPRDVGLGQSYTEAQENQGRMAPVPLPRTLKEPGHLLPAPTTPVACFTGFLSWSDLPHFPAADPLLSTYECLPQIPSQTLQF